MDRSSELCHLPISHCYAVIPLQPEFRQWRLKAFLAARSFPQDNAFVVIMASLRAVPCRLEESTLASSALGSSVTTSTGTRVTRKSPSPGYGFEGPSDTSREIARARSRRIGTRKKRSFHYYALGGMIQVSSRRCACRAHPLLMFRRLASSFPKFAEGPGLSHLFSIFASHPNICKASCGGLQFTQAASASRSFYGHVFCSSF